MGSSAVQFLLHLEAFDYFMHCTSPKGCTHARVAYLKWYSEEKGMGLVGEVRILKGRCYLGWAFNE